MAKGTIVAFHKNRPICFVEDDLLKARVLILKTASLFIGDRIDYLIISSPNGLIGVRVKKLLK